MIKFRITVNNIFGNVLRRKQVIYRGLLGKTVEATATKANILQPVQTEKEIKSESKVSLIGVGAVGMAVAFSIISKSVCSHLCLIDTNKDKAKGEALDLQHASLYFKNMEVSHGSDYALTNNSKICIIAAGVRQKKGETRLNLVQRNVIVMKQIIPNLIKYSPDTIIFIVSNPVDILTWVAWKISGLPKEKVIGSGTSLDSCRFRFLVSERLNIAPSNCHGFIIGEHGDSSVPVWSGLNVASVQLLDINPNMGTDKDPEKWKEIHDEVVQSAYKVIALKGYTSWAIGKAAGAICVSILRHSRHIHAVSVFAKDYHGIKDEVYISLPAVVSGCGITSVIRQNLTESERKMVQKSADTMAKVQAGIKF